MSDPTSTLQCKSAILTKPREGSRSFGSGPFAKVRRRGGPTRFVRNDTEISCFISGGRLGRFRSWVVGWSQGCRVYAGFGRVGGILQLESPLPLDTQLTFSVEHQVRSDRAPAAFPCMQRPPTVKLHFLPLLIILTYYRSYRFPTVFTSILTLYYRSYRFSFLRFSYLSIVYRLFAV